jgi:negative regulator of sigma E activity
MESLHDELKEIHERQNPSADFTARVMAQVRAERTRKKPTVLRWAAVGALAASLTLSVYVSKQRQQTRVQQRAEQAEAQLIESLQVAGIKIGKAREAVLRPAAPGGVE